MIRHVIEVWLLLLAAFVVGGVLGTFAYVLIAETPFAERQEALAAAVGRGMDRVRRAVGLAPTWGPDAFARPAGGYYDNDYVSYDVSAKPDRPAAGPEGERPAEGRGAATAAPMDDTVPAGAAGEDWQPPDGEAVWDDDSEWDPAGSPETRAADSDEIESSPDTSADEPDQTAMRPAGLAFPRNGVPDDLQRIRGIGKKNEAVLNGFGVFHFGQIAAWTPAEVRWMAQHLSFPERIERDDWIGQATILATGGDTGYVKAAARRAPSVDETEMDDVSEER
ncbi:MAG: hypothetical protein GY798_24465 [Hyphomicrobiales bacterium]|nr:hypothetical protein [Hyphomicrobiales bacterium]